MLRHVTPETAKSSGPIRIAEPREDTGSLALASSHGSGVGGDVGQFAALV